MAGTVLDVEALLASVRGRALRLLAVELGQPCEGLTIASRMARRSGLLDRATAKKAERIDIAFAVVRHLVVARCEEFLTEVQAQCARGGTKEARDELEEAPFDTTEARVLCELEESGQKSYENLGNLWGRDHKVETDAECLPEVPPWPFEEQRQDEVVKEETEQAPDDKVGQKAGRKVLRKLQTEGTSSASGSGDPVRQGRSKKEREEEEKKFKNLVKKKQGQRPEVSPVSSYGRHLERAKQHEGEDKKQKVGKSSNIMQHRQQSRAKHHAEQKDGTQAAGWLIRFLVAGFGVVTMLGVAFFTPHLHVDWDRAGVLGTLAIEMQYEKEEKFNLVLLKGERSWRELRSDLEWLVAPSDDVPGANEEAQHKLANTHRALIDRATKAKG